MSAFCLGQISGSFSTFVKFFEICWNNLYIDYAEKNRGTVYIKNKQSENVFLQL